jgi:RloB-like protein
MPRRNPPKLSRKLHKKEPRRRFIIFCEGENTEPTYFAAIKRETQKALIKIEISGGCGVPYTIAEKAIKEIDRLGLGARRRKRLNSFEERDEVWAVFDRDEHPRFQEAVNLCNSHGVKVGRSNPCFELWLILHYCDFDRPDDRRVVQKFLESKCPEYDADHGKFVNCSALLKDIEAAEKRADVLLTRREGEGTPFGAPSTTVCHLTKAIYGRDTEAHSRKPLADPSKESDRGRREGDLCAVDGTTKNLV